jgi:hypothetical protein
MGMKVVLCLGEISRLLVLGSARTIRLKLSKQTLIVLHKAAIPSCLAITRSWSTRQPASQILLRFSTLVSVEELLFRQFLVWIELLEYVGPNRSKESKQIANGS